MLKIAYCGRPHTGGTYTVFRLLREGLAQHDIDLRWVCLASDNEELPLEMKNEVDFGKFVRLESEAKKSAQNFVKHIENKYDGVIFNVLARKIETSTAKYISNSILKLQIVHSITPATYLAANAIKNHVHATICPSPRIARDLASQVNFQADRILTIPHAVNLDSFPKLNSQLDESLSLKLLYLGRIEENAKGVFWLPEILQECLKNGINTSLTIVGDGLDLEQLKLKINQMGLDNWVDFYGKANYKEIPQIFASHHIFIMPSRYEGFGYSLVEAMASGCVPVCSRITGVTDFIISDKKDGFLFPVGDTKQAALCINKLTNAKIWQEFSNNAKTAVKSRFTLTKQAESYANLIIDLKNNFPEISTPLSLDNWHLPSGLKPRWATYLPNPVKNMIRTWRERITMNI